MFFKALAFLSVCLLVKRREDARTPAPSSQTLTQGCLSEEMSCMVEVCECFLVIMCADVCGLVGDALTLLLTVVTGFSDFSCLVFSDRPFQLPVKCLCCQLNHLLL